MRQFALTCVLALLIGCSPVPSSTPSVTLTLAPDDLEGEGVECAQAPFAPPIGLEVGGRGQVADGNFDLGVSDQPRAEAVARLQPLETFTVLEGPRCWRIPPTSNYRTEYRGWRVRAESRDVEGWIAEYVWYYTVGIVYLVRPLKAGDMPLVPGNPLLDPVTFSGALEWTSFGGPLEPRTGRHALLLRGYGYITLELSADNPNLVNPDLAAGSSPCRVIVLVDGDNFRRHVAQPQVIGSQIAIGQTPVERLWVEPGEYHLTVMLVWFTNVGSWDETVTDPTCPDTSYTLTISRAQNGAAG